MTKRERFERLKYGLFVHYVPSITCDGSGRFITDIDELVSGKMLRQGSDR